MESTLKKGTSQFNLIGVAKVNDFTFKTDEQSSSSDWVYNSMKLGVNCGQNGDIYAEMMGGYGADRDNVIYVHGTKENEAKKMVDDWSHQYTIDWEDRFDESILEEIGNQCFITVGIEKDTKGKTFTKKFLSEYDAIAYVKEHLEDGDVVNVKGDIEYSVYNDNIQTKKKITSLFLSKMESDKHTARFTQTILVDKDSLEKKDKDKNVYPISAYVVEYINKPLIDGEKVVVKENVALQKEFALEIKDEVNTEKLAKKLFKPTSSKAIFEVTVEGLITKGGSANVTMTVDELPEDIQELIELGAFSAEEALEKCVGRQSSVESFIITNPQIRRIGEEKTPVIAFDKEKYKAEEILTYAEAIANATDGEVSVADTSNNGTDNEEFDMDALLEGLE